MSHIAGHKKEGSEQDRSIVKIELSEDAQDITEELASEVRAVRDEGAIIISSINRDEEATEVEGGG